MIDRLTIPNAVLIEQQQLFASLNAVRHLSIIKSTH